MIVAFLLAMFYIPQVSDMTVQSTAPVAQVQSVTGGSGYDTEMQPALGYNMVQGDYTITLQ